MNDNVSLDSVIAEYIKLENKKTYFSRMTKDFFKEGKEIVFRSGNMKSNHNAMVIAVCGPRIKIRNMFTNKERWIFITDVIAV